MKIVTDLRDNEGCWNVDLLLFGWVNDVMKIENNESRKARKK